jgi:hypothetical protein
VCVKKLKIDRICQLSEINTSVKEGNHLLKRLANLQLIFSRKFTLGDSIILYITKLPESTLCKVTTQENSRQTAGG